MTFEQYLAKQHGRRKLRFQRYRAKNPFADEFASELNDHLHTVEQWISGKLNVQKMRRAMEFFDRYFPGKFGATEGRKLFRGQSQMVFDGSPRSYSYDLKVAEAFAGTQCGWFAPSCKLVLIERTVCSKKCADQAAFKFSLDLTKLIKAYASHKYALEREVVILNTQPKGQAKVFELVPA